MSGLAKAMAIPSPRKLEGAIQKLRAENLERRQAEARLRETEDRLRLLNDELERRVEERTRKLQEREEQLLMAKDAADAAALARGGRAFYYRPNADVDALVAAASGVLAREPGSSRALAIRATALAKKG